jgi:hypothetical protein
MKSIAFEKLGVDEDELNRAADLRRRQQPSASLHSLISLAAFMQTCTGMFRVTPCCKRYLKSDSFSYRLL